MAHQNDKWKRLSKQNRERAWIYAVRVWFVVLEDSVKIIVIWSLMHAIFRDQQQARTNFNLGLLLVRENYIVQHISVIEALFVLIGHNRLCTSHDFRPWFFDGTVRAGMNFKSSSLKVFNEQRCKIWTSDRDVNILQARATLGYREKENAPR